MRLATFCGALAAGLLALGTGGCESKNDPAAAAKEFIQLIRDGKSQAAYDSAAFAFQAQQSPEFFETATHELGLDSLAAAAFSPPEIEGGTAKVTADFETKDRREFSLHITLTEESGLWRVFAMKSPRSIKTGLIENKFSIVGKGSGFIDPVNRQSLPDEESIRRMTLKTMLDFNAAVAKKSFDDFYETLAVAWQKQVTANALTTAFQPFIEKDIDVSSIRDVEFVFDAKPEVNTEGLMIVYGHYPTKPYEVLIELKYMYEVPKWRLFGIDVKLTK